MISVVAPCLNEEKHLPQFMESLALQTFRDFEVIIVDGGSTDYTLWMLAYYFGFFMHMDINVEVLIDKTRNFGFVRNLGASHAAGDIMLQCNTDNYLEPTLLEQIDLFFRSHPETMSLSGRVHPMGTSVIAHISYQLFDLMRFLFTVAPMPIKKYRPSGNFMAVRTPFFRRVGGYPEVSVNEDGLFGQKLDPYVKVNHKAVAFNLSLHVGHHVKKFEEMGGLRALLFYFYTLANFAPMLKPLLQPIEDYARQVFQGKHPPKQRFKELLQRFWDWL